MTLQLSGLSERLPEPRQEFYGQPRLKMPLLVSGKDKKGKVVDVPREPASFAYVLERRMTAPEEVRPTWQEVYFFTGDGSTAGTDGDHLLVLDAQYLRKLTPESELYEGALVLPPGSWHELKGRKEKVLHLTAEEVRGAHGQGYVKKEKVWTPANRVVGKIWEGTDNFPGLARGRIDVREYAQLVSESSPSSSSLLTVYFNQTTKEGKPTMRSFVAESFGLLSVALGSNSLAYADGRLVGLAPEMYIANQKVLEARVQSAFDEENAIFKIRI